MELISGCLVEKEAGSPAHGQVLGALGELIFAPFHRKSGGRLPGGWWIAVSVATQFGEDVFLPDFGGWRRERVPAFPQERPVAVRPDWVCEVLSPSNARIDRVEKLRAYHRAGVPHYWLVDPLGATLTVLRHTEPGYVVALTAGREARVKVEPFTDVELPVGRLFGDDVD